MLEPGDSLGVANSFDGMPANASTKTSRNTATTVIAQGIASRSTRGGTVPRYPGARGGGLVIRRRRVSRAAHRDRAALGLLRVTPREGNDQDPRGRAASVVVVLHV